MRYSDDLIEEVIHRNDIVELIGENVRLKRTGASYTGLCPFHSEKTPSFSVSPSKQVYYCFGCHAGGNIITFVMEYYNYTFVEALKFLADRAGMALPEEELTEEQRAEHAKRNRFLEVYKEAANFYYFRLKTPAGADGMNYLKKRGLTDETIRKFGLGYADKFGNSLYRHLKGKNYDDAFLKESGLFRFDEKNGARDLFYNRVMFPIQDVRGRVIGFGGRVMGDAKPKYLNSPETFIFNKRQNLYALHTARSTRRNYIILCEGYMDVITMHQAGFTNACASLGTALTAEQCNLLRRYTGEARLLYDSDGAGINAALRAIPLLKDAGIRSRVVNLKPSKDPDEFINSFGAEELEKRLDESENAFLFECDRMSGNFRRSDPGEWTEFQHRVLRKLLTDFPDEIERENYLQAVCARYGFDLEAMRKMMVREARIAGNREQDSYGTFRGRERPYGRRTERTAGAGRSGRRNAGTDAAENYGTEHPEEENPGGIKSGTPGPGAQNKKAREDSNTLTEELMLSYLANYPEAYSQTKDLIAPEDFLSPVTRKIADLLYAQLEGGTVSEAALVAHFPDSEEMRTAAGVFHKTIPVKDGTELDQAFTDTVIRLKQNSIDDMLARSGDIGSYQEYIKERNRLEKFRKGKRLHLKMRNEDQ